LSWLVPRWFLNRYRYAPPVLLPPAIIHRQGPGEGEKYTKDEFYISGIVFLHFPYTRKIQGMVAIGFLNCECFFVGT
jgi:hypothetical protein